MIRSLLCLSLAFVLGAAAEMPRIAVSADGNGFVFAGTNQRFQAWGVNYGNAGRLMEDFWNDDWKTFADDFAEIRELKLTNGNREQAAKMLEIGERTLYRKIKEYGLTE